jgi:glucose-1-phosphate adenylyltransferase
VHPVFNLYNMDWPILTLQEPLPPAKFIFADDDRIGHALDSMVCSGVIVSGATVRTSVLSPRVHLHSHAQIDGSVLFSGVEVGRDAVVHNAILDKDVYVEPGAEIGIDLEADREAGFTVSDGGVVVVQKGARVPARLKT